MQWAVWRDWVAGVCLSPPPPPPHPLGTGRMPALVDTHNIITTSSENFLKFVTRELASVCVIFPLPFWLCYTVVYVD